MVDMAYVHGLEKALEIIENDTKEAEKWEKEWEDLFYDAYESWQKYHFAHSFYHMVLRAENAHKSYEDRTKYAVVQREIKKEIEAAMSVDADVEGEAV